MGPPSTRSRVCQTVRAYTAGIVAISSSEHGAGSVVLDEVDRAILRVLIDDGRLSVTEVARQVNVSRASAYNHLERLTETGIITGYGARVDPRRLGHEVSALVFLRVDQGRWRSMKQQLLAVPEVEFVGLTSGDFDFVVLVRATSTDNLRDVVLARLLAMDEVRNTRTMLLFDDVVRGPHVPEISPLRGAPGGPSDVTGRSRHRR